MALAEPLGRVPAGFSLLMPVYHGDRARYIRRALESNTVAQTRPPDQVVIVRDGPLPPDLAQELERSVTASPVAVTVVELARNSGLATALTTGLAHCTNDVVARADADDVSYPRRFERQLPLIEAGADLVGSAVHEIGDDETPVALRRAPVDPAEIAALAKRRNPMSHPSVVFRRSAVEAVGGYLHVPLAEDYWLWVRMLHAGAQVRNVDEPLVGYRVSGGAYERRGGLAIFRADLLLQSRLRAIGYVGFVEWLRNVILRGGYRLMPLRVREAAYRWMVNRRGA